MTNPAGPPPTLDQIANLLDVLADGRAHYADGYPAGDNKDYLDTQVATLRTVARIFRDPTSTNAGLFLPTHMLGEYQAAQAALGFPVADPVDL